MGKTAVYALDRAEILIAPYPGGGSRPWACPPRYPVQTQRANPQAIVSNPVRIDPLARKTSCYRGSDFDQSTPILQLPIRCRLSVEKIKSSGLGQALWQRQFFDLAIERRDPVSLAVFFVGFQTAMSQHSISHRIWDIIIIAQRREAVPK